MKIIRQLFVTILCCLSPGVGAAQPDSGKYQAINITFVDQFAVPAYEAFDDAATHLARSAEAFCENMNDNTREGLVDSYYEAMDAWQWVQMISIGPISFELRRFRIQLWPDRRGNVSRHLDLLLSEKNTGALSGAEFQTGSVAVQGLSALEILIFDESGGLATTTPVATENDDSGFRCQVINAIAQNVASIAKAVRTEWTESDDAFRGYIETASLGNAFFDSADGLSARILHDLRVQLQTIVEYKIERPLSDTAESTRLRRAESWRSQRTIHNIRINLKAIHSAYDVSFRPFLSEELALRVDEKFNQADELLAPIGEFSTAALIDPVERERINAVIEVVDELVQLFIQQIPAALDLNPGLTSLDGD
ncbi:MAG: hypothetical protein DHS20C01_09130 [marine bacterium B5-7]|nr:MAG: hypothetical protein DHS20C01_09130 [marine bacterium B5-7]